MTTAKKRMNRHNPASRDFKKEVFPFYWLAQVNGRYIMAMEKVLKKVDMDVPRWRILLILKDNGTSSISEVSTLAIAKLSTVTKIIDRMKAGGLVQTSVCCNDRRVTQVALTDAGYQIIEQSHKVTADIFKNSFKGLTGAQLDKLSRLLKRMFDNLPED